MDKVKIKISHALKQYGNNVIIPDLSVVIEEGEFFTLLGPSGCGKTTLLRILGGFLDATEGEVIFDGEDISQVPAHKRELNTVFQKYALFPHMSVYQNIAFGLKIKNKSDAYIKDKIKYALKLVNLEGFEKRKPTSLSGGQQQRIAIARAIISNPRILIFDEATSALDYESESIIQNNLQEICKGRTVLIIAHRLSTLKDANKIMVIDNGELVEFDTKEKLMSNQGLYYYLYNMQKEGRV